MGAELGVAREWVSRLENGDGAFSPPIQKRIMQLERDPAVTLDHISGEMVIEPQAPYGAAGDLRQRIARHVRQSIDLAGDDVSRLGWLLVQAETHMTPPPTWRSAADAEGEAKGRALYEEIARRAREAKAATEAMHGEQQAG